MWLFDEGDARNQVDDGVVSSSVAYYREDALEEALVSLDRLDMEDVFAKNNSKLIALWVVGCFGKVGGWYWVTLKEK